MMIIKKVKLKYIEKLKRIEAEGTISQDDFESQLGVEI